VLPRLSIATKLYLIFALLAAVTVVLATAAVLHARSHVGLTDDFESALAGAKNVERVNGLIYAVVMESRGVYMSPDAPAAKRFAEGLLQFNDRVGVVVTTGSVRCEQTMPSCSRHFRAAVSGVSSRVGAPRRRDRPGVGARMGRQRCQPHRPHGAKQ
jgi:hypothetical protein